MKSAKTKKWRVILIQKGIGVFTQEDLHDLEDCSNRNRMEFLANNAK